MNFNEESKVVDLGDKEYKNMLKEAKVSNKVDLEKYDILMLKEDL